MKLLKQARQRNGGNFYIDCRSQSTKVTSDILPSSSGTEEICSFCSVELYGEDVELIEGFQLKSARALLDSDDILKHEVIYIAVFLALHRKQDKEDTEKALLTTEFLEELNRVGLCMPTLTSVAFTHCAMKVHDQIPWPRKHCEVYFLRLLSKFDCSLAKDPEACKKLKNTLCKAFVLHNSDTEKQIGCLRRKEKLSN